LQHIASISDASCTADRTCLRVIYNSRCRSVTLALQYSVSLCSV